MKYKYLHLALLLLLALALLLWLPSLGAASPGVHAVPARTGHVVDLSGVLNAEQHALLEQRLRQFGLEHGSEVAVLLLPSTRPEGIDQYALRVAEQWKLGRQNVDDGALVLVATADRAARIEVGYGLEGTLTDVASKRLIEEVMLPHLQRGDFFAGVEAGTTRLLALLGGDAPTAPAADGVGERQASWLAAILMAALMLGKLLRHLVGRVVAAAVAGSLAGLSVWVVTGALALALGMRLGAFVLVVLGIAWLGLPGMLVGGRGGPGQGGGRFGGGGASGRW
jgi:uncharacterized protein